MSLVDYQRKRNFGNTHEPSPEKKSSARGRPIFVVQLHHASHRHYDFRLQVGDVLKSWAVPKGPSFDPAVKRLAAEVEDHPLGYAGFEGVIPEGQYGAGHVAVFDNGIWATDENPASQIKKGHLRFELFGKKLKGGWHLIRTARSEKKPQWLLVKQKDRFADKIEADDLLADIPAPAPKPGAKPVKKSVPKTPAGNKKKNRRSWATHALKLAGAKRSRLSANAFQPQLAKLASIPPNGAEWIHEIKWDGYRISVFIAKGKISLWSRNGLDWTKKLPDIVSAIEQLGLNDAFLDAELIAHRGTQEDFGKLQATLAGERQDGLTLVLLDLLHIDGISIAAATLQDRKKLLARVLAEPVPHLALSSHIEADGADAFRLATSEGFEGIVSKRKDRGHHAGRADDWIKIKKLDSEEFAVVGYTAPKGSRHGFGALLLARRERGQWKYAGKVGSGFSDEQIREIIRRIGNRGDKKPTVQVPENDTDLRSAKWFAPDFVVEVYSRGVGTNGLLRQPSVKTIRLDKTIMDISKSTSKKSTVKTASKLPAELTHPDKIMYPENGYTKQDVADYYNAVSKYLLAEIKDRPLSLIRCPSGVAGKCFFQKHEISGVDSVETVRITEQDGDKADYLVVREAAGIMELVQHNTLEFHPWGSKALDPDLADRIVFDLDPGPGVSWSQVRAAARQIRKLLQTVKLESFVRTSGGKGLHVVVPLNPPSDWTTTKQFAKSFAESMSLLEPDKFVATVTKSRRDGRIFIDYLRNGKGATSVASYSLRAREGAPVAVPLSWTELSRVSGAASFTIKNVPARLAKLQNDPWQGIATLKQNLKKLAPQFVKNTGRTK